MPPILAVQKPTVLVLGLLVDRQEPAPVAVMVRLAATAPSAAALLLFRQPTAEAEALAGRTSIRRAEAAPEWLAPEAMPPHQRRVPQELTEGKPAWPATQIILATMAPAAMLVLAPPPHQRRALLEALFWAAVVAVAVVPRPRILTTSMAPVVGKQQRSP